LDTNGWGKETTNKQTQPPSVCTQRTVKLLEKKRQRKIAPFLEEKKYREYNQKGKRGARMVDTRPELKINQKMSPAGKK